MKITDLENLNVMSITKSFGDLDLQIGNEIWCSSSLRYRREKCVLWISDLSEKWFINFSNVIDKKPAPKSTIL